MVSQLLNEFGHDSVNVAHEAIIGDVKNRRVGIAVDGHDGARVLHASQVLNRARNTQRDVQLRGDDFTGLADLEFVRCDAGIDQGTRASNRAAQDIRQSADKQLKVLAAFNGSAS